MKIMFLTDTEFHTDGEVVDVYPSNGGYLTDEGIYIAPGFVMTVSDGTDLSESDEGIRLRRDYHIGIDNFMNRFNRSGIFED